MRGRPAFGALGRRTGVAGRTGGAGPALGAQAVVDDGLHVAGTQAFDDPGGRGVPAGAAGVRDVLVQRLAHQGVREPRPVGVPLDQEAREQGGLHRVQHPVLLRSRQRDQHVEVDLLAEHGGLAQMRAGDVRQRGQAVPDDVPHPGRDRVQGLLALALPHPRELPDEERVPAAARVDRAGVAVAHLMAGDGPDQLGYLPLGEAAQVDPHGFGPRDPSQRLGQPR